MALVCVDCHHYVHDTKQTLYRDRKGKWKLRDATPDEIPPPQHRPHPDKRPPDRNERSCTHAVTHE